MKKVILLFLLWGVSITASELKCPKLPEVTTETITTPLAAIEAASRYEQALAGNTNPSLDDREKAYTSMLEYIGQLANTMHQDVLDSLVSKLKKTDIVAFHLIRLWQKDNKINGPWKSFFKSFCDKSQEKIMTWLTYEGPTVKDLILSLISSFSSDQLGNLSKFLDTRDDDFARSIKTQIDAKLKKHFEGLGVAFQGPIDSLINEQVTQLEVTFDNPQAFSHIIDGMLKNLNGSQKKELLKYLFLSYGGANMRQSAIANAILFRFVRPQDFFTDPFPFSSAHQLADDLFSIYINFVVLYPSLREATYNPQDPQAVMLNSLINYLAQIDALIFNFFMQQKNYTKANLVLTGFAPVYINELLKTVFSESYLNQRNAFKKLSENEKVALFSKIISLAVPHVLTKEKFADFAQTIADAHARYGLKKNFSELMNSIVIPLVPSNDTAAYASYLDEAYELMKKHKRKLVG